VKGPTTVFGESQNRNTDKSVSNVGAVKQLLFRMLVPRMEINLFIKPPQNFHKNVSFTGHPTRSNILGQSLQSDTGVTSCFIGTPRLHIANN
jgi:hypothetical protein